MTSPVRLPLGDLARSRWEVLVIGGGITGAAVFREAAALGLRTLLIERDDFASGTSSHSAKLVHGGLHYLSRFQLGLARESIRERDLLLRERAGLVESIDFILPVAAGDRRHAYVTSIGLGVYQAMGGKLHRAPHIERRELERVVPGMDSRFEHALRYTEGQTDDARLTLRVILDGQRDGGTARHYIEATSLLRDRHGIVRGAELKDALSGETVSVTAQHVVNAAGPWSDTLRAQAGLSPRQRLIRGSHLIFPRHRLPLETGLAVYHPESGLPLYILPWRTVTIVGTTHVNAEPSLHRPARCTRDEASYLLAAVKHLFPELQVDLSDTQASFAGYRPIIDTHTIDPARASRDAGIWVEDGLITVTGGKLTTHRSMARQVLRRIAPRLSRWPGIPGDEHRPKHPAPVEMLSLQPFDAARISALFGHEALDSFAAAGAEDQRPHPELGNHSIAELRWSARHEQVAHLDDLLARRTRISLLAPEGGMGSLGLIEPIARAELGWDQQRWLDEIERYRRLWVERYRVAPLSGLPIGHTDVELRRTG